MQIPPRTMWGLVPHAWKWFVKRQNVYYMENDFVPRIYIYIRSFIRSNGTNRYVTHILRNVRRQGSRNSSKVKNVLIQIAMGSPKAIEEQFMRTTNIQWMFYYHACWSVERKATSTHTHHMKVINEHEYTRSLCSMHFITRCTLIQTSRQSHQYVL